MPTYKILNATQIIDKFKEKLNVIRTNRVNASILDLVYVDVPSWGGKFKIVELATVTNPMPGQLVITPFDLKATLSNIEKAIRDSDLGVNPVNNGAGLILNFPQMTTDERKKRVTQVEKLSEETRIIARNERQTLLKKQKASKEAKEITEDDLRGYETDLQKEIDAFNKEIDSIVELKSTEIMKI